VSDLLTAFGLIGLAELGDKSQLLALSFATRHRWWQVLIGVGLAAATLLGVATLLGTAVGGALPDRAIAFGGGVLFLGFAAWTWFASDDDGHEDGPARSRRSVILAITAAFIVAELGDKTMLGTATLATTRDAWATWIGATAGMTAVSGLAIGVGQLLHRRLPTERLRVLSTVAFAVFGVLLVVEGFRG
jgi:Ca2+/H+ antiporter, TMEM165/GDT1 family